MNAGVCTYIRRIADELAKKDLLVAIKSVDDEAQKLVDLRLECKCLGLSHMNVSHCLQLKVMTKHREREERR